MPFKKLRDNPTVQRCLRQTQTPTSFLIIEFETYNDKIHGPKYRSPVSLQHLLVQEARVDHEIIQTEFFLELNYETAKNELATEYLAALKMEQIAIYSAEIQIMIKTLEESGDGFCSQKFVPLSLTEFTYIPFHIWEYEPDLAKIGIH